MKWILAVIGILVIGWLLNASNPRPPMSREESAKYACQLFVERTLNDPSSAEFTPKNEWSSKEGPGGTWTIRLGLRATNSFNAKIYGEFTCVAKDEGTQWRSLSLVQTAP